MRKDEHRTVQFRCETFKKETVKCVARPIPPWCTTWTSRRPASPICRTRGKEGSYQVSDKNTERVERGFRGIEMICELRLVFVTSRNEYARAPARVASSHCFSLPSFPSFHFHCETESVRRMGWCFQIPFRRDFSAPLPKNLFPLVPMSRGICTLLQRS